VKLIFCKVCSDLFKLTRSTKRSCKCGESSGQYKEDGWYATYSGAGAVAIGVRNTDLAAASALHPESVAIRMWSITNSERFEKVEE